MLEEKFWHLSGKEEKIMSRIGNSPIQIPSGVDVKISGNHITVKGPKGNLERDFDQSMVVKFEDGVITVERPNDNKNIEVYMA